jgi:polyhydroxybutyrate depolymerase
MLLIAALACAPPALQAANLPSPAKPGTYSFELKADGQTWTVHVHIPKNYNADVKPPLVLAFHGAGGEGKMALENDGWAAKADQEGFIVAAPTGIPSRPKLAPNFLSNPRVWNSGQLNPLSPRTTIDDVAFVRKLLDELKEKVPYEERRVFAVGHSNGGGMTFRLAAEMSERLMAIATVAGVMAVDNPKLTKPLPTLYILGEKDPLVPLDGGEVKLPWGKKQNPPVAEFLEKWATALGCQTKPTTLSDSAGIKKVEYASSGDGPPLTVLYLENQGHAWPGGKRVLPESMIGPMKSKLNATDTVWEFFQHCR